MTEITQEQVKHLEGFTEKRDQLVSDISERVALRDSLGKELLDSAESLRQINQEIEEKKAVVIDAEVEKQTAIQSFQHETTLALEELNTTKDKVTAAKSELTTLEQLLVSLTETIKNTLNDAIAIKGEVLAAKKEVTDAVNTIAASASTVTRVTSLMSNSFDEYHNKLIAHEIENKKRSVDLDVRETNLNVRETAMNDTFGEVMSFMKSEGVTVVDK